MSFLTATKDYAEILHQLVEHDPNLGLWASDGSIKAYNDLGNLLTYFVINTGSFFNFSWLKNLWSWPIIVPDISAAMISEVSIFGSGLFSKFDLNLSFSNTLTPLSTSVLENKVGDLNLSTSEWIPYAGKDNHPTFAPGPVAILTVFGERFITGFLNSFFLFLPTSTSHFITLRRFIFQGTLSGFIAGFGTIAGNLFWLTSIIFGWRFFVIPWLSFDLLRYFLGFILIIRYFYDSFHETSGPAGSGLLVQSTKPTGYGLTDVGPTDMYKTGSKVPLGPTKGKTLPLGTKNLRNTGPESHKKMFWLNFVLALTEQSTIYPFIGNISFRPTATALEGFYANTYTEFIGTHFFYLFGIFVGSFSLLKFTYWLFEEPFYRLYLWVLATWPRDFYAQTAKRLKFVFLYITMVFAVCSIPYYGLDYIIMKPLGFVNNDELLTHKVFLESSFINTAPSDYNTRQNRFRHSSRERWNRRLKNFRSLDTVLYDGLGTTGSTYDLLTLEDTNYGFDRFWYKRKKRSHEIRYRLIPAPLVGMLKKSLLSKRLKNERVIRLEFFDLLYQYYYHPSFHDSSKKLKTLAGSSGGGAKGLNPSLTREIRGGPSGMLGSSSSSSVGHGHGPKPSQDPNGDGFTGSVRSHMQSMKDQPPGHLRTPALRQALLVGSDPERINHQSTKPTDQQLLDSSAFKIFSGVSSSNQRKREKEFGTQDYTNGFSNGLKNIKQISALRKFVRKISNRVSTLNKESSLLQNLPVERIVANELQKPIYSKRWKRSSLSVMYGMSQVRSPLKDSPDPTDKAGVKPFPTGFGQIPGATPAEHEGSTTGAKDPKPTQTLQGGTPVWSDSLSPMAPGWAGASLAGLPSGSSGFTPAEGQKDMRGSFMSYGPGHANNKPPKHQALLVQSTKPEISKPDPSQYAPFKALNSKDVPKDSPTLQRFFKNILVKSLKTNSELNKTFNQSRFRKQLSKNDLQILRYRNVLSSYSPLTMHKAEQALSSGAPSVISFSPVRAPVAGRARSAKDMPNKEPMENKKSTLATLSPAGQQGMREEAPKLYSIFNKTQAVLHPIKQTIQNETAFRHKFQYYGYGVKLFRKIEINNPAPFFKTFLKRFFYYYKPTRRWQRTIRPNKKTRRLGPKIPKVAYSVPDVSRSSRGLLALGPDADLALARGGQVPKGPTKPVAGLPYGSSGFTLAEGQQDMRGSFMSGWSQSDLTTGPGHARAFLAEPSEQHMRSQRNMPPLFSIRAKAKGEEQEQIVRPTHLFSLQSKKAERCRRIIHKDVMLHGYYAPLNRFLIEKDIDFFINRQPKANFLTKKEERLLHLRRFLLAEHYNTLRWYNYANKNMFELNNQLSGKVPFSSSLREKKEGEDMLGLASGGWSSGHAQEHRLGMSEGRAQQPHTGEEMRQAGVKPDAFSPKEKTRDPSLASAPGSGQRMLEDYKMTESNSLTQQINEPKSFANKFYNQQFQGTFKKIRHLFAMTPNQGEQPILKFDQILYNETANSIFLPSSPYGSGSSSSEGHGHATDGMSSSSPLEKRARHVKTPTDKQPYETSITKNLFQHEELNPSAFGHSFKNLSTSLSDSFALVNSKARQESINLNTPQKQEIVSESILQRRPGAFFAGDLVSQDLTLQGLNQTKDTNNSLSLTSNDQADFGILTYQFLKKFAFNKKQMEFYEENSINNKSSLRESFLLVISKYEQKKQNLKNKIKFFKKWFKNKQQSEGISIDFLGMSSSVGHGAARPANTGSLASVARPLVGPKGTLPPEDMDMGFGQTPTGSTTGAHMPKPQGGRGGHNNALSSSLPGNLAEKSSGPKDKGSFLVKILKRFSLRSPWNNFRKKERSSGWRNAGFSRQSLPFVLQSRGVKDELDPENSKLAYEKNEVTLPTAVRKGLISAINSQKNSTLLTIDPLSLPKGTFSLPAEHEGSTTGAQKGEEEGQTNNKFFFVNKKPRYYTDWHKRKRTRIKRTANRRKLLRKKLIFADKRKKRLGSQFGNNPAERGYGPGVSGPLSSGLTPAEGSGLTTGQALSNSSLPVRQNQRAMPELLARNNRREGLDNILSSGNSELTGLVEGASSVYEANAKQAIPTNLIQKTNNLLIDWKKTNNEKGNSFSEKESTNGILLERDQQDKDGPLEKNLIKNESYRIKFLKSFQPHKSTLYNETLRERFRRLHYLILGRSVLNAPNKENTRAFIDAPSAYLLSPRTKGSADQSNIEMIGQMVGPLGNTLTSAFLGSKKANPNILTQSNLQANNNSVITKNFTENLTNWKKKSHKKRRTIHLTRGGPIRSAKTIRSRLLMKKKEAKQKIKVFKTYQKLLNSQTLPPGISRLDLTNAAISKIAELEKALYYNPSPTFPARDLNPTALFFRGKRAEQANLMERSAASSSLASVARVGPEGTLPPLFSKGEEEGGSRFETPNSEFLVYSEKTRRQRSKTKRNKKLKQTRKLSRKRKRRSKKIRKNRRMFSTIKAKEKMLRKRVTETGKKIQSQRWILEQYLPTILASKELLTFSPYGRLFSEGEEQVLRGLGLVGRRALPDQTRSHFPVGDGTAWLVGSDPERINHPSVISGQEFTQSTSPAKPAEGQRPKQNKTNSPGGPLILPSPGETGNIDAYKFEAVNAESLYHSINKISLMVPINPIPFYAGWDDSLRKFVITNRLLSRREAGYQTQTEVTQHLSLKKTNSTLLELIPRPEKAIFSSLSPQSGGQEISQNPIGDKREERALLKNAHRAGEARTPTSSLLSPTIQFTHMPIQYLSIATNEFKTTFAPFAMDQAFSIGHLGHAPLGWRRFKFKGLRTFQNNRLSNFVMTESFTKSGISNFKLLNRSKPSFFGNLKEGRNRIPQNWLHTQTERRLKTQLTRQRLSKYLMMKEVFNWEKQSPRDIPHFSGRLVQEYLPMSYPYIANRRFSARETDSRYLDLETNIFKTKGLKTNVQEYLNRGARDTGLAAYGKVPQDSGFTPALPREGQQSMKDQPPSGSSAGLYAKPPVGQMAPPPKHKADAYPDAQVTPATGSGTALSILQDFTFRRRPFPTRYYRIRSSLKTLRAFPRRVKFLNNVLSWRPLAEYKNINSPEKNKLYLLNLEDWMNRRNTSFELDGSDAQNESFRQKNKTSSFISEREKNSGDSRLTGQVKSQMAGGSSSSPQGGRGGHGHAKDLDKPDNFFEKGQSNEGRDYSPSKNDRIRPLSAPSVISGQKSTLEEQGRDKSSILNQSQTERIQRRASRLVKRLRYYVYVPKRKFSQKNMLHIPDIGGITWPGDYLRVAPIQLPFLLPYQLKDTDNLKVNQNPSSLIGSSFSKDPYLSQGNSVSINKIKHEKRKSPTDEVSLNNLNLISMRQHHRKYLIEKHNLKVLKTKLKKALRSDRLNQTIFAFKQIQND